MGPIEELPILVIGEATYTQDYLTVSTYRWQHEEQSVHGPNDLILVSIGVWTGGTFLQDDRSSYILGSEFLRFHEGLVGQLQGENGTARVCATGNAFSLAVSSGIEEITAAGSILDSRSRRVEEFRISGMTRSLLVDAVQSLSTVLEWFDLT